MSKYAIVLLGTSIIPTVISLKYFMEEKVDKIYLIASETSDQIKGTSDIANSILNEIEYNFEVVIIPRYNLQEIKKQLEDTIVKDIEKDKFKDNTITIDYTGGTKLQSSFIREYFESLKSSSHLEKHIQYLNGDKRTIFRDNGEIKFGGIDGAESEETVELILKLKGVTLGVDILKEEIEIENYRLKFNYTIIESNAEKVNWNKQKLVFLSKIKNSEYIGEEFCEINFKLEGFKKDKSESDVEFCSQYKDKILNQLLGIKKRQYEHRIEVNI